MDPSSQLILKVFSSLVSLTEELQTSSSPHSHVRDSRDSRQNQSTNQIVSCHDEADEDEDGDVREMRGELRRMEVAMDCGYPEDLNDNAADDEDVAEAGVSAGCCCCMNLAEKSCEASKSSVVILSFGSLRRRELMTTRASGEIELGIWNSPRRIFPNR